MLLCIATVMLVLTSAFETRYLRGCVRVFLSACACSRATHRHCSCLATVLSRTSRACVCLQFRKFVSLFTGEYIYKKLKWEWRACDGGEECEGAKED